MSAILKQFTEVIQQNNFNILKELHDISNKLSFIRVDLTPSDCCKSNKERIAHFIHLNDALMMDVAYNLVEYVQMLSLSDSELLCASEPMTTLIDGSDAPAFSYTWEESEVPEVRSVRCNRHSCFLRTLSYDLCFIGCR